MDNIVQVNLALSDLTGDAVDALLNKGIGHDTAASDGPWYHARANVLTETVEMTRETSAADLAPATYDGHAQQQITWNNAVRDDTDESFVRASTLVFIPTGDATIGTQQLKAVGIYGSDSVTLLGAINLPHIVTVTPETPLVLIITLGPLAPSDE